MLRRPTALKLLSKDKPSAASLTRFEREVQLTSELTHPNTIAVYDFGRSPDGTFYYAMEYLEGINLEQLVHKHGPQSPARVIHILCQVCGALDEAHSRGLIHRDIKPANVILCWRGRIPDFAKVLDFGLVKDIDEHQSDTNEPVIGTVAYMPPEAIIDPKKVGVASDLYSLGATAFFLMTGRVVFPANTMLEMAMCQVKDAPESAARLAPAIPPALDELISDCLAKDPKQRPASVSELLERLRAIDVEPWTEEMASTWWDEHPLEKPDVRPGKPSTITVDVTKRTR